MLSLYTIFLVNLLVTTGFIKYNLHGLLSYVKSCHLACGQFYFLFFFSFWIAVISCFIAFTKICSPWSNDSVAFRSMA